MRELAGWHHGQSATGPTFMRHPCMIAVAGLPGKCSPRRERKSAYVQIDDCFRRGTDTGHLKKAGYIHRHIGPHGPTLRFFRAL